MSVNVYSPIQPVEKLFSATSTQVVPHKHKMNPVKHGLSVLSGILQLFTVKRPLVCFGIPGLVFILLGGYLTIRAMQVVAATDAWLPTTTLGSAMMLMMGMLLWSVALILFSISKLVRQGSIYEDIENLF